MKFWLQILAVFCLLVSCQNVNRMPEPDNLIPEEKMVDVLTEISLLHGARSYNKMLMEEKGIDPYPYLTRKFGIDSSQLAKSNDYYAQNYKQYKRIYDSVKVRLELLVVEYDSLREQEERRLDSLAQVSSSSDTLLKEPLGREASMPLRIRDTLPVPVFQER